MLAIPEDTAVPGVGVVHLEDAGLALHERRDAGAEPAVFSNNVCRWRRASRYPRGRGVREPAALPYDVRAAYASLDVPKSISDQRQFTHALLLDTFASLVQPPKTAPELGRIEQLRAMAMALPTSL